MRLAHLFAHASVSVPVVLWMQPGQEPVDVTEAAAEVCATRSTAE